MQMILHVLPTLNPLTVLASTAIMLIVRTLFHSRFLFGRAWKRMSGSRIGDVRPAQRQRRLLYTTLMTLATAALLGCLAEYATSIPMFISLVVFVWLFIMLEQLNGFIRRNEPFAYFLMQTLRSLCLLLSGGIIFMIWS